MEIDPRILNLSYSSLLTSKNSSRVCQLPSIHAALAPSMVTIIKWKEHTPVIVKHNAVGK